LSNHQIAYRDTFDYRLPPHLPVILQLQGKGFKGLTAHLQKPFSPDLYELLGKAMHIYIPEIQGAVAGYLQTDEITFILRNDQSPDSEPWYNNRIQDIVSSTASQFTNIVNQVYQEEYTHLKLPQLMSFSCRAWTVPTLDKASELLTLRQWFTYHWAVDRVLAQQLQQAGEFSYAAIGKSTLNEKKKILKERFGIDMEARYPSVFYRGIGVYRTLKWYLDQELPSFVEDPTFLLGED